MSFLSLDLSVENMRVLSMFRFASTLSYLWVFCLLLLAMPQSGLFSAKPFIGSDKSNKSFKKEFSPKVKNLKKESVFTGSRFKFQEWDKHYSKLGQKKMFSEKQQSRFNHQIDKEVSNFERLELNESDWNNYFSHIRKNANIDMDEKAQILSDRITYTVLLQDPQQFEEMAEQMDLRSINRFQFRSNRPKGEIPVDKADGNNEN